VENVIKLVSDDEKQIAEAKEAVEEAVTEIKEGILAKDDIISFAGVCINAKGEAYLGAVGSDGMLVMLGALDLLKQQLLDETV
jgi:hypothetical protein